MDTNKESQSTRDLADWNQVADQYSHQNQATAPIDNTVPIDNTMYTHMQAIFWETIGDIRGQRVLDLGCGDGWLSGMAHDAGAHVVGVDGSARLLEFARQAHPATEFIEWDLAQGLPPQLGAIDLIVSTMLLMDIPDVTLLFVDLRRVLTENGRFIFTILHPCFFGYKRYYDPIAGEWYRKVTNYQEQQTWREESFGGHNHYHRTLTYYTELLRTNGFAITRLYEPEWDPGPEKAEAYRRQWPIVLLVEAQPFHV